MRTASCVPWLVVCVLAGCGTPADHAAQDAEGARQAYETYREVLASGDPERLKSVVSRERARELTAPNASELMQLASAMRPEGARLTRVTVNGDRAVLKLAASDQGTTTRGTVQLVREDGAWKVGKEDWQVQISLSNEPAAAPEPDPLPQSAARPTDYAVLLGRWRGDDGSGAGDWTLSFAPHYAVSAQHASGAFYRGQAAIFWNLGAEGGLRVPAGWSVLDVQVAEASEASHVGQVSLGTFSLQGDALRLCGSEPGSHVRTQSVESPPAGVRCLTLTRVSDADVVSVSPAGQAAGQAAQ